MAMRFHLLRRDADYVRKVIGYECRRDAGAALIGTIPFSIGSNSPTELHRTIHVGFTAVRVRCLIGSCYPRADETAEATTRNRPGHAGCAGPGGPVTWILIVVVLRDPAVRQSWLAHGKAVPFGGMRVDGSPLQVDIVTGPCWCILGELETDLSQAEEDTIDAIA